MLPWSLPPNRHRRVHGTAGSMAWMTVPFIDAISGFVGLACESDDVERADRLELD